MIPQGFWDKMQGLLGEEFAAFQKSFEREFSPGLRLNPLKSWEQANLDSFHLTPVPWAEHGYYYDPQSRPGLSPYHEAGLYYIQEPSAMAPAQCLSVQIGMRVLDLCAAPGGKSTQIAAKLQGEGLLVSNEIHPQRAKILSRNLERMGIANALCLNEHPARLAERFFRYFDRIMVDAPCSGEGMFRKEAAAGEDWSQEITEMCAHRQGEILESAAQMLRGGGRMVYSTCTFSPEENEGVIAKFLKNHPDFHLVSVPAPHFAPGRPQWAGGNEALAKTCRLFPHLLRGEGHFVAVLERDAGDSGDVKPLMGEKAPKELLDFLRDNDISLPEGELISFGQNYYLAPPETPDLQGLKVLRAGLSLGQVLKNRFEPDHALALWLKSAKRVRAVSHQEAAKYLRGETLTASEKGWTLVQIDGLSLGWGKASDGILKNHFPKGLRSVSSEKE